MTLELPHGVVLRLGRDLDGSVPDALRTIDLLELAGLLSRLARSRGGATGSGARDWADFAERIYFIAVLFRSRAESVELFDPPFGVEQLAAIDAGRRPDGRL